MPWIQVQCPSQTAWAVVTYTRFIPLLCCVLSYPVLIWFSPNLWGLQSWNYRTPVCQWVNWGLEKVGLVRHHTAVFWVLFLKQYSAACQGHVFLSSLGPMLLVLDKPLLRDWWWEKRRFCPTKQQNKNKGWRTCFWGGERAPREISVLNPHCDLGKVICLFWPQSPPYKIGE